MIAVVVRLTSESIGFLPVGQNSRVAMAIDPRVLAILDGTIALSTAAGEIGRDEVL